MKILVACEESQAVTKELRKTALKREHMVYNKLKRIEDICKSIPSDWSIVGIEKIHEIEEIINEH